MKSWKKLIIINGEEVEVTFIKRPFREGLEIEATYHGERVRLGDLGLGEEGLIEALREAIKVL